MEYNFFNSDSEKVIMLWVFLVFPSVFGLTVADRILYIVDIGKEDTVSLGQKIAAQACQGLMNRSAELNTLVVKNSNILIGQV